MKDNRKITSSEKKLFVISGIVIALILGFGAWWQWVNAVPDVEIPTPKLPSPNAYDFYVKAGAARVPANPPVDPIHDTKVVPKAQWKTHYPVEKKEAWLRQNAMALKLLRQGFQYPCRVPPQRSFYSTLYKNNGSFRELARMLIVESHVYDERGDLGAAANSALDIFELGYDLSRGGIYVNYLTGAGLNGIGLRRLWEILPRLNAAESKTAMRRLEKIIQSRVPYADILREEKYFLQASTLEIMRLAEWRTQSWDQATGLKRLSQFWHVNTTPRRVIFKNYSEYMDAFIASAQKPYTAKTTEPPLPDDFYNRMVAPTYFVRARWLYARYETSNALLLVALALRAHKLEHNSYPQNLSELVPRSLTKIPADPYGGGEALRYKLRGAEYSLYSIGPDGIDNGGRAIEDAKVSKEKRGRYVVRPESKGDMVAGVNQ